MAIQRWEMLLSAQADCYLLKIQGDRSDVDKILQAHPKSCPTVQEISEDVFQWVIFVVDAPLAEKLAIQNQVMSLTGDASGTKPSQELISILDGLSDALQDLTNLTDEEQTFVMNKMAKMGSPAPALPPAVPPATAPRPPAPSVPPAPPRPPAAYPPAGAPLPRVTLPGRPGAPAAPKLPTNPPGPAPASPGTPAVGTPLPPGAVPNIVRPVQPPRSFPGMPKLPGAPLPSVPLPQNTPLPQGAPKPPAPLSPPVAPVPIPRPPLPPAPTVAPQSAPVQRLPPLPPAAIPKKEEIPLPAKSAPPPKEGTDKLDDFLADLSPAAEPRPAPPPKVEPPSPAPPPPPPPVPPKPAAPAAESPRPPAPPAPKTEDSSTLRLSIFYPTGQEAVMNRFLNTLTDVAQKKSKRPTAFQVALSFPTTVALENSTEWIWKAKTSGSDLFFVVLPDGLGSELMDPLVEEAQAAGLRCFLVPQGEVGSKLLYMDLMVELMMFKRRIRPVP